MRSKRSKTNKPTKYQAEQLRNNGTRYDNTKEYYHGLATRLTKKWFKAQDTYVKYWIEAVPNAQYCYNGR
jgi:hypothetical protein